MLTIRKYNTASSVISGANLKNERMGVANINKIADHTIPKTIDIVVVCEAYVAALRSFFAPILCPTATSAPIIAKIAIDAVSHNNMPIDPIAASDFVAIAGSVAELNLPTHDMANKAYAICKKLVPIRGKARLRRLENILPSVRL
jgi:hypothetical protein